MSTFQGDSTQNVSPFNGINTGEWRDVSASNAGKFPNPWVDYASDYVPRNLQQVFEYAEYIFLTFGTYRQAARRVSRYFLTEIVLEGGAEEEREKYEAFVNEDLHLLTQLADIGDDYMCLHGDTPVVTQNGILAIRDLAGKTVDVLSDGGVYRPAKFKSYGRQELMEVTLSDGRTILATPEHQWVALNCSGKKVRVPTTTLTNGYRIERTVAPRPEKGELYREGVRHGFVFGDGSVYNKTRKTPKSVANFFGAKDEAVKPFFADRKCTQVRYDQSKVGVTKVHGLPADFKKLPANDAPAEYWYGFVCGLMAADGSVDKYGCPLIVQVSRVALSAIAAQLPRIGMAAGPISEYEHTSVFTRADGSKYTFTGKYCRIALLKQFMRADDLIIGSHIKKFTAVKATNYGKYIDVKSVARTGIVDEVFCCVEPETHTFVIDNGTLTGNCYGNVFISLYFPFDRYLACKQCSTSYHIDTVPYRFEAKKLEFHAHCPKCGFQGAFERQDIRSADRTRVRLIRWNPKRMRLRVHDISGEIEYYYEPEPRFVDKLRQGNRFYLNKTPWAIVECCAQGAGIDQPMFKFEKDQIYHMHEATLSGLPIRGWAIPPILPNFKLAFFIQVLRRMDEAIALDYIIPFRIIYPDQEGAAGAGSDPLSMMSMDVFMAHMQGMVKAKRMNNTDLQIAPFKIGYQMLGAEGKNLTPKDNIIQAMDELLNAIGYPAELYRGSLSIQAFPVALRLFEKTWGTMVDGYNDLIKWVTIKAGKYYGWGPIESSLQPCTLADDIERKALQLQAAAGGDVSKTTAYRPLGINYMSEQEKVLEEQTKIQQMQQEAQESQEASQANGQPGQDQGGPGGDPGATPGDVNSQAKDIAYQLVTQVPENQRRGQLIKIKNSNPTLHALVLQEMNALRQQMASQGQSMMLQQAQAQGAQKQAMAEELKKFPSTMLLGLHIAGEIMDYSPNDLRKLACAIRYDIPNIKEFDAEKAGSVPPSLQAFRFIYRHWKGWETL